MNWKMLYVLRMFLYSKDIRKVQNPETWNLVEK